MWFVIITNILGLHHLISLLCDGIVPRNDIIRIIPNCPIIPHTATYLAPIVLEYLLWASRFLFFLVL
jgi:hypothetical protein